MTDEITRGDYFAPVRSDVSRTMKVGVPGIGTRSIIAAILGTFAQAAAMHRSIGMERLTCGWSCSYCDMLMCRDDAFSVCVCGLCRYVYVAGISYDTVLAFVAGGF